MVPSVLPWVPLPLPGGPKRRYVLYFMRVSVIAEMPAAAQRTNPARSACLVSVCSSRRIHLACARRFSTNPQLLRCGFGGDHVHAAARAVELNLPVHQRENRVVAAKAHIPARDKLRPALPDDDVTRDD